MRIAAYTYNADTFCPVCIIPEVRERLGSLDDGPLDTESALNLYAQIAGVDRMDEVTYDSNDFPKVVFSVQIDGEEHCGRCGDEL